MNVTIDIGKRGKEYEVVVTISGKQADDVTFVLGKRTAKTLVTWFAKHNAKAAELLAQVIR